MTLRINATHRHSDRGLDPYWTPDEATRSLLEIERLPHVIWEPAAGAGAISKVLRSAGHKVTSSDIARYDDFDLNFSADYLTAPAPHGVQAIITNPPFRLALQFAAKAIAEAPYVALLLRLNFLESVERLVFFSKAPPARILVSSRRLPMMHRLGWAGRQASSGGAHEKKRFLDRRGRPLTLASSVSAEVQ